MDRKRSGRLNVISCRSIRAKSSIILPSAGTLVSAPAILRSFIAHIQYCAVQYYNRGSCQIDYCPSKGLATFVNDGVDRPTPGEPLLKKRREIAQKRGWKLWLKIVKRAVR